MKLIGNHRDIRRSHATSGLPATRAIAVGEPKKRRPHLVADRFAKTTSSKYLIGHLYLLVASPIIDKRLFELVSGRQVKLREEQQRKQAAALGGWITFSWS